MRSRYIKIILLVSIILSLTPLLPVQAETTVNISADKLNAVIGEQIQVTISVESKRNAPEPRFPTSDAYDVYSRGQSHKVQIINGSMSSSLEFNYIVVPKKTGRITIPAIPLKIGRETAYTKPLVLNISTSSAPQSSESDKYIFMTAEVDDNEAFINQQIIFTLRFYTALRVQNASLEPLEFEGFQAEQLEKPREYNRTINGRKFSITEIRYALFPQKSGTLTINGAKLQCQVYYRQSRGPTSRFDPFNDPFFGFGGYKAKNEFLTTQPIDILVSPLPQPSNQGSTTSLVGEFNISADINPKEIKVGESSTLTVEISGKGNIHSIPDPVIEEIPDVKTYEDKPQLDIKITLDGISGTKIFKRAIVPTKAGEYKIPALKLPYLDPKSGQYKISSTRPLTIKATPGSEDETINLTAASSPTVQKEMIKLIGHDILPQKTRISALKDQSVNPLNPLLCLLLIFPPLTFLALLVLDKKRQRNKTDQAYFRRKNALKAWGRNKKAIRTITGSDAKGFYSLLGQGLKQFLGDRLNITGTALTPAEINHRLKCSNVPENVRKELTEYLKTLEMGAFGALHQTTDERAALLDSVEKIICKLVKRI